MTKPALTSLRTAATGRALAAVAGLAALGAGAVVPGRLLASSGANVIQLAGRWSGDGVLTPYSGPQESFKCVVTYFPSDDGSQMRQNLRCKGAARNFDAATHLKFTQGRVTGAWQDNVYSLNGSVSGTVTDSGFDVVLSGQFFEAKMTVVSSSCQQSVTITPRSSDMKELAAVLKKC